MRTLLTFGLGAAAMYFFDPQQGERRRARLREQLTQRGNALRVPEVRTKLEPDRPAETPPSAHHLGR